MILHHTLGATELAEHCLVELTAAGIDCTLDVDPGINVFGGPALWLEIAPGLWLESALGEDPSTAANVIRRVLDAR